MKQILPLPFLTVILFFLGGGSTLYGQQGTLKHLVCNGQNTPFVWQEKTHVQDTLVLPLPQVGYAWYVTFTQWQTDCNGDYLYVYKDQLLSGTFSCKAPETIYESEKRLTFILVSDAINTSKKITFNFRQVKLPVKNDKDLLIAERNHHPLKSDKSKVLGDEECTNPMNPLDHSYFNIYGMEDDWVVCQGRCAVIGGMGEYSQRFTDHFNGGNVNGNVWESTEGAELTQGCQSVNGSNTLWFGGSAASRQAITRNFQVDEFIKISFWFRYGNDTNRTNNACEEADLEVENVKLQYLYGDNWITVTTFSNNGTIPNGPYDHWKFVCLPLRLPLVGAVKFRLYQEANSGIGFDQWAIEDFSIDAMVPAVIKWQFPDGGISIDGMVRVCPTQTGEYTMMAYDSAGHLLNTQKRTLKVIPESEISGTLSIGKTAYCPGDQPNPINVINYNGRVSQWQVSYNCNGVWQNIYLNGNDAKPVYTPPADVFGQYRQAICYRAYVRASDCEGYTPPLRLSLIKDSTFITLGSKDSSCSGDLVKFTILNPPARILRWEVSNDNQTFELLQTDTSRTITVPIYIGQNYVRAVFDRPSCIDPSFTYSQAFHIRFIGVISDPPKTLAYGECSPPLRRILVLHTFPIEVAYWEVKPDPFSVWSRVPASENKLVLEGDPYFVVGYSYRVKLNPQNRPNKCDPALDYLGPIIVPTDLLCCCAYKNDSLCAGDLLDKLFCVNPNCGLPIRYERAYNPNRLPCTDFNLRWTTLPHNNFNPITGCYHLQEVMTSSFCIRTLVQHPFDPNNLAIGASALIKVYREVRDRGTFNLSPRDLCAYYNNGLITFGHHDPGLKVIRWEEKIAVPNSSWITMNNNSKYNYVFDNLRENRLIRAFLIDTVTNCEYYSDTLNLRLNPNNGRPGIVLHDTTLCPDNNGVYVVMSNFNGEPMRWERNNDPDCSGIWEVINLKDPFHYDHLPVTHSFCYRSVVRYNDCIEMYSPPAKVTYQPFPEKGKITVSDDNLICAGQPGPTLTVSDYTGNIVRWEKSYDCVGFTGPNPIANTTNTYSIPGIAQNTCFRAVFANGPCELPGPHLEIAINPSSFPGKLYARGELCAGGKTNIDLSESTGQILRWEFSENEKDWTIINHQERSYETPALTKRTCYRVWVKTSVCPPGPTDPVCISITPNGKTGTISPIDTICPGANIPPVYISGIEGKVGEWQFAYNCVEDYYAPVYNLSVNNPNILITDELIYYPGCIRAKVDRGICGTFYSEPVRVNLYPSAQAKVSQDQTICNSKDINSLKLIDLVGRVVRWESSLNQRDWSVVEGSAGINSYTPVGLTESTYFRAVLISGYCTRVTTDSVKITVLNNQFALGYIQKDQNLCSEKRPDILRLMTSLLPIADWEYSPGCNNSWKPLEHVQTEYQPSNLTQTTCYRVRFEHPSCGTLYTSLARITVLPLHDGGWLKGPEISCASDLPVMLKLIRYAGEIVKWQHGTNGSDWADVANTSDSLQVAQELGTKYRVVLSNPGECTSQFSSVYSIEASQVVKGGSINIPQQFICSDTPPQKLILTNYQGNIAGWEASVNGIDWFSIGEAGQESYSPPVLTRTTYYRAVVYALGCPTSYSETALINIGKAPKGGLLIGNSIFCSNEKILPVQLINYLGTISRWEISTDSLNWTYINTNQTTYNPTGNWNQIWIRVKVSNSFCGEAYSNIFKITRRAAPRAGTLERSGTVCTGNRSPILLLRNYSGSIIGWEQSLNGIDWHTIPNANQVVYQSLPLTQTTYFRVAIGTPNCSTILSNAVMISVSGVGSNLVIGKLSGKNTVCQGQNIRLNLSETIGAIKHWEYSDNNWQTVTTIANTTNLLIYPQNQVIARKYRVRIAVPCGEAYCSDFMVTSYPTATLQVHSELPCGQKPRIVATSNVAGVTYSLEPQVQSSNKTGIFNNLSAGNYVVVATTPSGCQSRATITVNAPTGIVTPSVVSVIYPNPSSAIIRWNRIPGGGYSYIMRYRVLGGGGAWVTLPAVYDTSRHITGLAKNTEYEVEVAGVCGKNQSDWSKVPIHNFRTQGEPGDCNVSPVLPPVNLQANALTPFSGKITWNPIRNTIGYIVSYGTKLQNPNTWIQVTVCAPETSLNINGLSPNVEYAVRIRTNCTNCTTANNIRDRRSDWSQMVNFKTTNGTKEDDIFKNPVNNRTVFHVYPNPTQGLINLRMIDAGLSNDELTTCKLLLSDLNGKTIFERELMLYTNTDLPINLPEITQGLYLLHIRSKTSTQCVKLVID